MLDGRTLSQSICYAEQMSTGSDLRRSSPAAMRNRGPILEVLRSILPGSGMVLEVASGTGEHVVYFANHFPSLEWQPTDPSSAARASISAWIAAEALTNILPPLDIDVTHRAWKAGRASAIVAINLLHISPWGATIGLLRGASKILPLGGPLYLYGPFRRQDRPFEPSNQAFDDDLRSRDPNWGIRGLEDVIQLAVQFDLALDRLVEMPSNNMSVIFRRR